MLLLLMYKILLSVAHFYYYSLLYLKNQYDGTNRNYIFLKEGIIKKPLIQILDKNFTGLVLLRPKYRN